VFAVEVAIAELRRDRLQRTQRGLVAGDRGDVFERDRVV